MSRNMQTLGLLASEQPSDRRPHTTHTPPHPSTRRCDHAISYACSIRQNNSGNPVRLWCVINTRLGELACLQKVVPYPCIALHQYFMKTHRVAEFSLIIDIIMDITISINRKIHNKAFILLRILYINAGRKKYNECSWNGHSKRYYTGKPQMK